MLINVILPTTFQSQVKDLLTNYKDVCAWNYKELRGIPQETCEYKTKLITDAQPIKQK